MEFAIQCVWRMGEGNEEGEEKREGGNEMETMKGEDKTDGQIDFKFKTLSQIKLI